MAIFGSGFGGNIARVAGLMSAGAAEVLEEKKKRDALAAREEKEYKRSQQRRTLAQKIKLEARDEKRAYEEKKEQEKLKRIAEEEYQKNLAYAKVNSSSDTYSDIIKLLKHDELDMLVAATKSEKYYGSMEEMVTTGTVKNPDGSVTLNLSKAWRDDNTLAGDLDTKLLRIDTRLFKMDDNSPSRAVLLEQKKQVEELIKRKRDLEAANKAKITGVSRAEDMTARTKGTNQALKMYKAVSSSGSGVRWKRNEEGDISPDQFNYLMAENYYKLDAKNFFDVTRNRVDFGLDNAIAIHGLTKSYYYLDSPAEKEEVEREHKSGFKEIVHSKALDNTRYVLNTVAEMSRIFKSVITNPDISKDTSAGSKEILKGYTNAFLTQMAKIKKQFNDPRTSPVLFDMDDVEYSNTGVDLIKIIDLHNEAIDLTGKNSGFLNINNSYVASDLTSDGNRRFINFQFTQPVILKMIQKDAFPHYSNLTINQDNQGKILIMEGIPEQTGGLNLGAPTVIKAQ
tara:strand:- start:4630 stop:6159 length:1530 start_codon:yes stop_codon:yes gene_type:complete